MPIFELQGPDGKTYEVDAPDMETATKEFAHAASGEHKSAAFSEGKAAAQQRIAAPNEYVDVPVYGPDGAATGATERVLKPKADPIGAGFLSVFPYGGDIATMGKGMLPFTEKANKEKLLMEGQQEAMKEAYPGPYRTGQAGSIGLQIAALRKLPLPGATWGAAPLAEGASLAEQAAALGARAAGAGAGGATIGGVTGFGEGSSLPERLKHAAIGTVAGGALGTLLAPAAEGVGALGSLAYRNLIQPNVNRVRSLFAPEQTAERLLAGRLAGDTPSMTPQEFAAMRTAGEPVMLADVGGRGTRNYARDAANLSPEADVALNEPITQRFIGQTGRVEKDIRGMFPDSIDYAQKIESLNRQARRTNKPAYDKAYDEGSSGVFNDELYNLMQAPAVRDAMKDVGRRAKNQEVFGEPIGDIVDPFAFNKEGQLIAKEGMSATDANLRYWDIVKRNLDDQVTSLYKGGKPSEAGDIKNIRDQLRDTLDNLVPSYGNARKTAAQNFGAENAFEAGINFAKWTDSKKVSEGFQAWKGMNEAEKELFARGYAIDLINDTQKVRDNLSVVNKSFMGTSPVERAKNLMALGPERSAALEARLRTEQIMDQLRTAVQGGSQTAKYLSHMKQFMSYPAYGAAGALAGGDDITSAQALTSPGALAGLAVRAAKGKIDSATATQVARLLTSQDPAVVNRIMQMASRNPDALNTLRTLHNVMGKGAGMAAAEATRGP
jgi:hypothetical protein